MARFQPLSATAQTAYAQLLDAAQAADMSRTVADLRGSFASKQVKGRTYWYFQYTDVSGKLRQVYVGPDSERVRALIAMQGQGARGEALEALARSAEALGCTGLLPAHFRVLARLSEYGFFSAGGVLVGTHAFLSYANMLGVRWGDADRTQDIDFAHAGKHLELALPGNLQIDTAGAIDSLQMGLLPLVGGDGKAGASYLNPRDPDFQLDFLTPLDRTGEPFVHPQLGVRLQPLKFMEYVLEDVQQAALPSGAGVIVANVPHPARYALHKLIVAGERPIGKAAKSNKDLRQAAALLEWFRGNAAWQVDEAWRDLVGRGPGWVSRVRNGRASLAKIAPELEAEDWLAD